MGGYTLNKQQTQETNISVLSRIRTRDSCNQAAEVLKPHGQPEGTAISAVVVIVVVVAVVVVVVVVVVLVVVVVVVVIVAVVVVVVVLLVVVVVVVVVVLVVVVLVIVVVVVVVLCFSVKRRKASIGICAMSDIKRIFKQSIRYIRGALCLLCNVCFKHSGGPKLLTC
jgi:hypothetical protein